MTRYPNSGALTVGLILISLGIIFLLENLYAPFSAWHLIARYWPVILIIIGLNKVCTFFFQRKENPESSEKTTSKE